MPYQALGMRDGASVVLLPSPAPQIGRGASYQIMRRAAATTHKEPPP